jgi:hypothetical protein
MMVPDRFYAKFDGEDPVLRHRNVEREDVLMTLFSWYRVPDHPQGLVSLKTHG